MAVTVETSPVAIQANSYSAELFRRGTFGWELQRGASVGSVVGGLVGGADLQVTYGGSGLNLAVAAGECIVPGSSASTQSGYYLRVTTAGTLTPAAASGANPRIDLVYAQVQDQAYTGSSNLGTVAIATGTPTGGASLSNLSGAPAVPTSAIAIAYILIPQSAATINNSDILNEYTMAYFGPNIFNATPTSTSGTASSGQHVIVSANSPTITLPAPFKNARVKVTNYGSGATTVSHNASEVIYGSGFGSSGTASFGLGVYGSTATLESDGTNWYTTASKLSISGLIYASATTSIPNITATHIALAGVEGTLSGFTVTSNNLVASVPGLYHVDYGVNSAFSAGNLIGLLYKNGVQIRIASTAPFDTTTGQQSIGSCLVALASSDTLGLWAFQDSGGSGNASNRQDGTYLHAVLVS